MVLGTTTGTTDNWVSEELCMAATTKLGNEYKGSLMEQMQSEYVSAYVRNGLQDSKPPANVEPRPVPSSTTAEVAAGVVSASDAALASSQA